MRRQSGEKKRGKDDRLANSAATLFDRSKMIVILLLLLS